MPVAASVARLLHLTKGLLGLKFQFCRFIESSIRFLYSEGTGMYLYVSCFPFGHVKNIPNKQRHISFGVFLFAKENHQTTSQLVS